MRAIHFLVAAALLSTPPALPSAANKGCVGPSPVTATEAPWAQTLLAPRSTWPLTEGRGVVVAVVDTGVSSAAPALAGAVLPGVNIDGGHADSDCAGRGTALAGIIAARPSAGIDFVGMAPQARILPIRITDVEGKITTARLAAGIRAATAARASIILVATGIPIPSSDLADALQAATASDILVVAAVNEEEVTADKPDPPVAYPAAFDEALAVNDIATDGTAATTSARAGVDLASPGAGTFSIAPYGPGHYAVSGAGVAAAYVAGTAALIRAYHPEYSQAEVRARLELTAIPPPGGDHTASLGAGLLDPYAAVTALAPRQATAPIDATTGAPDRLRVALTAPASPSARRAGWTALAAAVAAALTFCTTLTLRRLRTRRP
jgi:membrane-anchored mycosin MYCP